MNELVVVLEEERQALEELLFKLVAARGLMTGGDVRFIGRASDEIDQTVVKIHGIERRREQIVARLAVQAGDPTGKLSLRKIAEASGEPYRTHLNRLRKAFLELTDELEQVTAINRGLAEQANHELENLLRELTGPTDPGTEVVTYGPDAVRRVSATPALRRQDRFS